MTKMQASEIEQFELDDKSFNRWCEVSLPKVYSFFALILFAGFFCKCSARISLFCSSIIEYSFQNPTMNLTVNSTN